MEDEYRDKKREAAILKKSNRWENKMYNYIMGLLDDAEEDLNKQKTLRDEAKSRRRVVEREKAKERAFRRHRNEALNEEREEKMRQKSVKREEKEMAHYDQLSQEVEEELDWKRECLEGGIEKPEITKVDVTKCITRVPTMTELFWAVKSNVDELKFLKQVDLEPLSKLYGVPPLVYVADLNREHEAGKLTTPCAVGEVGKQEDDASKKKGSIAAC